MRNADLRPDTSAFNAADDRKLYVSATTGLLLAASVITIGIAAQFEELFAEVGDGMKG